jgi:hypothetical protein
MAVQSTYRENLLDNSPGTMQGSDHNTETGICETASPGIPFGRAVSQGSESDQGVIIGGSLAGFRGVSQDVTLGAEQDAYLPPNNVGFSSGTIWVEPNEAVAADDCGLLRRREPASSRTNQSSVPSVPSRVPAGRPPAASVVGLCSAAPRLQQERLSRLTAFRAA